MNDKIGKKSYLITAILLALSVSILNYYAQSSVKSAMAVQRHIPVSSIQTATNCVALTYNMNEESNVDIILSKLKNNKITFFISDEYFHRYPMRVQKIIDSGHSVGLLERQLKKVDRTVLFDTLANCIEEMSFLTCINCNTVRIETNRYDSEAINAIYSIGLYPVQWSATDSNQKFKSGDIILITDNCNYDLLFKNIEKSGCKIATVNNLLIKDSYYVDANGTMIPLT